MQNIPQKDGFLIQSLNGVSFRLREPFDFSFMERYGTVFRVFDDQDSGNICFGTEKDGRRYFVKFAGAPTARGGVTKREAIENLQEALPVYRTLRHKNLIRFAGDEAVGGGYAMLFDWTDGISMGRMYPQSKKRFMKLPLSVRQQVFCDLLDFFIYLHDTGYVAVDFYDGSVMYDPKRKQTVVCDIDFFGTKPYVNEMGRLWGSARFMAPEEYQKGAEIDEITNIHTLGVMAFALFADYERDEKAWPLSREAYAAAVQATQADRGLRQRSFREMKMQWEAALKR